MPGCADLLPLPLGGPTVPYGAFPVFGCIEGLGRETFGSRLLVTLPCGRDDAANTERLPARRAHFNGHLVGCATDSAGTHLDRWHHVVERLLEHGERVLLGLALDHLERAVDNPLCDRFLAVVHDGIHEFADDDISEL